MVWTCPKCSKMAPLMMSMQKDMKDLKKSQTQLMGLLIDMKENLKECACVTDRCGRRLKLLPRKLNEVDVLRIEESLLEWKLVGFVCCAAGLVVWCGIFVQIGGITKVLELKSSGKVPRCHFKMAATTTVKFGDE